MRTLFAYALLVVVVASVAVQAQAPAGGEFRVNNATAVGDIAPSIAADASGAFVVTWSEASVTPPVKARRFNPQGVPRGDAFTLASSSGFFGLHSVASDERGRTMMVWMGDDSSINRTIRGRLFNPSGAPVGSEFVVNQPPASAYDPALAAEQGGNFVVVWEGFYADGSGSGIVLRRFDLAGNPLGPQVRVNTYTTNDQAEPSVASIQSGGFVVVWTSGGDGSLSGVFGRRFNAGGVPVGSDFQVNAYTTGRQFDPQVVTDAQGVFFVVWQDRQGTSIPPSIIGRRFDPSGAPLGPEFLVGGFSSASTYYFLSAAADRTGNFTVLWEAPDGSGRGVVGRRFTSSGAPRGPQFRVNASTTSEQRFPDLASDGAGNLFATWQSGQNGSMPEIYARRFGGLVPAGLSVVDNVGNGVLEVGDDFTLRTSWRNVTGSFEAFQGTASELQLPPGLTGTLSADANYPGVFDGQVASCDSPCFAGSVTGTRPAGHLDGSFLETIVPDAQGQTRRRLLHIGESFGDVPRTSPFYRFVETVLHHGVSGGCGAGAFCPASSTPREQIAVMGLVGREGAGYQPPACGFPRFLDVPASSPFCRWIEELARRGIVSGCGGGNFCPSQAVTREQLCVIILLLVDPTTNPPPCGTPMFGDVPASSPFCRWIEELARRGVVSGCGNGNFCPTLPVTREQVSVFISAAFGLTLYGP